MNIERKRQQQISRTAREFVKNRLRSQDLSELEPICTIKPKNVPMPTIPAPSRTVDRPQPLPIPSKLKKHDSKVKNQKNGAPSVIPSSFNLNIESDSHTTPECSCSDVKCSTDIREELASWVVSSNTPAMHVDSLLKILRKEASYLPKCCKTLCKTPKTNNIAPMDNGEYLYIGLRKSLELFLEKSTVNGNKIYLDIGCDGVGVAKSSTSALWPILANVVGCDDVFLVSCFHGYSKPESADNLLNPFVEEFLQLKDNFVYKERSYSLCIRAVICDAPARAMLSNIIMYSGYNSCSKCLIPGVYYRHKVIFPGKNFEPRTNFSFRLRVHTNHHHSLDETSLERLPIDCVRNVPIDVMHCVYLGVVKRLLGLWINKRRRRYSIPKKDILIMSNRLIKIGPQLPSEFQRKLRSLKYWRYFKATEFRLLVLYILPVITKNILKPVYYNHFLKLHCALRILCDPVECVQNNELASQLLVDFVAAVPKLYGLQNMTFNMHSLLHLADDVMHFNAPLDEFSAFKFENFMQQLKKMPKTGYRVLEQIHARLEEKHFVRNFQKPRNVINKPCAEPGLYDKVCVNNLTFSTIAPNNYVKLFDNIYKIQEIYKDRTGSTRFQVKKILNLSDCFSNPISSSDINVFECEKETLSECVFINCTPDMTKVAAIKASGRNIYIALLH